jgi:hypothetical protein
MSLSTKSSATVFAMITPPYSCIISVSYLDAFMWEKELDIFPHRFAVLSIEGARRVC